MDKKEFAGQVEGIRAQLYRTAYLYLNNEASALEAVDESIYKALRALKTLRQPEYLTTWLTRILLNECKREQARLHRMIPAEDWPTESGETEDYDRLPLKEAIARLPEELRVVIILRYFNDYTLAQTAEVLDIPQGTAATRQRRALALLKLDLEEE